MKIIELLNKIANGEEVPKKIKYKNTIYEYDFEMEDYYYRDNNYFWLMENMGKLNDEVEIIEDTPKKIEKMKVGYLDNKVYIDNLTYNLKNMNCYEIDIIKKLNEIIDYINGE